MVHPSRSSKSRMDVVVVESPTKAKTINKYLGSGYRVLSSYGHVRDLPEKDGSVLPEEDFRIIYEPLAEKRQRIKAIAEALSGARHLYLATDPDREGEAISWHLLAALKDQGAINGVDVKRVVFHEITKRAARSTISSASRSRRCSGASFRDRARPAACSRWRCA